LLDRFALSVEIHGLPDPHHRVAIMERNLSFEADPEAFHNQWIEQEQSLSQAIETARKLVDTITYSKRDLLAIAALTASMRVDGHRADLVILKAARAHAAFEGRSAITDRDIALAAELALPHRLRSGPFQQIQVNIEDLHERINQIQSQVGGEEVTPTPVEEQSPGKKKVV
jgi:Mg-chelatase subunit ChlI